MMCRTGETPSASAPSSTGRDGMAFALCPRRSEAAVNAAGPRRAGQSEPWRSRFPSPSYPKPACRFGHGVGRISRLRSRPGAMA